MPHPAALDNALLRAKFNATIEAWVNWVADDDDAAYDFDTARDRLTKALLADVGACVSPLPATVMPTEILDDAHDLYSAR